MCVRERKNTSDDCPIVEAVLDYARDNLVMFNIFIKVTREFENARAVLERER